MITIAEVLHRTADEYLSKYSRTWLGQDGLPSYTCPAICFCIDAMVTNSEITFIESIDLEEAIFEGLVNMGVDCGSNEQYAEFPYTMMQDARYGWLKFAALMAEEQGV